MKKITLLHIYITNFMGCDVFESDFSELTTITGKNATGKSTIFTAFLWLLFGKNEKDQATFDIKNTVDRSRNRQDHTVTAELDIDGRGIRLTRTYREKWVKKRGEEQPEFSGHETIFEINQVPVSQAEYKAKVESICPENVFKMITNIHYFNEIDWKQRRTILTEIAGGVSDQDVAVTSDAFRKLLDYLGDKTIVEWKKEVAAQKKKIKEELEQLPARISEAHRAKLPEPDYAEIEAQIRGIDQKVESLERDKENVAAAFKAQSDKAIEAQKQLNDLKLKVQELEAQKGADKALRMQEVKNDLNTINAELSGRESVIKGMMEKIKSIQSDIDLLNKENARLREEWSHVNAQPCPELTDGQKACPSCRREWEADKLDSIRETIQTNHNAEKQRVLADITARGSRNKEMIEKLGTRLADAKASLAETESSVPDLEAKREALKIKLAELENLPVEDPAELVQLKQQIADFKMPELQNIDVSALNNELAELRRNREELSKKTHVKEINNQQDRRILELQDQEKALANKLAGIEKTEAVADAFTKAKNELVETRVNSMFRRTTFRMFEAQINGGEAEACVALYDGVPYNVVNTAGKINMGIDIINVLCSHYGISAPVFIDNTESVNKLDDCVSQVIKLQVSESPVLQVIQEPVFEFAN